MQDKGEMTTYLEGTMRYIMQVGGGGGVGKTETECGKVER